MHLLSVFATFAVGGPQVRYAAIANRFGDRYRHSIVAMDGITSARERLAGEADSALPPLPLREGDGGRGSGGTSFPPVTPRKGDTLGNRSRFRALLRELRPDVLITHNWGSIEWVMANLPRLVRHLHIEDGFGPEERERQIRRRVLVRRLLLARSTVVVPSRNLERIATGVWGLSPRRVRFVPNGIDLARFTAAPAAGREIPMIGTVAALRAEKNLSRLLRTLAGLRARAPARLVIAGDGPERAGLERLAAELGIADAVRFTGHVADPAPLYREFDVFALSSDTEQMPISVIEAMAAGLPVAATDVGDVRQMLAEENGPFVTPPEGLEGSLRALLGDAALRGRIGAANRARAEQEFDQERMFQAYAALFDEGR